MRYEKRLEVLVPRTGLCPVPMTPLWCAHCNTTWSGSTLEPAELLTLWERPEDRHAALIAGEIASSEVLLGFATPWTLMACEHGDSTASYDGPAPRGFSVRGPACYTPRRLVMVHPDIR